MRGMNAERMMRFTVVLVVVALASLILLHEAAPPAPAPESALESTARFDWLDDGERTIIEIGVPPESRYREIDPDLLPEESPAPPLPNPPPLDPPPGQGVEFTREVLERARAEGRAEARRAAELGNPTLMAGGYRAVGRVKSDFDTGRPIRTIGDDLDPYQVAFVDAYNREIHRLFASERRDRPMESRITEIDRLRAAVDRQARLIDSLDAENRAAREAENRRYVDRLAEGEEPDGAIAYARAAVVVVDLKRGDAFREGTRLMVWHGTRRIAVISALANSRVCHIEHLFGRLEIAEGMTVSNPFFKRGGKLRVALVNPDETTDVAAIRDRLLMMGSELVSKVNDADVVIRLNDDLTPIPGKIIVDSRVLLTFLGLVP